MSDSSDQVLLSANTESDESIVPGHSESTGHDLSQLMDLPLTEQSEDNSQWQSVNDIIGQLPVDQTGLSSDRLV
jgi:hypothetical protein